MKIINIDSTKLKYYDISKLDKNKKLYKSLLKNNSSDNNLLYYSTLLKNNPEIFDGNLKKFYLINRLLRK